MNIIQLLESAPSYTVIRGENGYPLGGHNIYAATTAVAMWNDPEIEQKIRDIKIGEQIILYRNLPFGGTEQFTVIRNQ